MCKSREKCNEKNLKITQQFKLQSGNALIRNAPREHISETYQTIIRFSFDVLAGFNQDPDPEVIAPKLTQFA